MILRTIYSTILFSFCISVSMAQKITGCGYKIPRRSLKISFQSVYEAKEVINSILTINMKFTGMALLSFLITMAFEPSNYFMVKIIPFYITEEIKTGLLLKFRIKSNYYFYKG